MANTKSAIKAARKALRLAVRNRAVKSRLKTLQKQFEQAVAGGNAAAAKASGIALASAMDRAAKSGVVHRNAANHTKSRVAKHALAKGA
ncbi:MAG: 30S ribosomal protein S20 [Verrucomicrobiota bacterium]|nr:30S ribosomal protein S20 [Verrucomicrobiota bacterium]